MKNNAPNTQGSEKYNSALILGKLYECGYGTKPNASEAQSWYQEALEAAPSDQQKNILSQKLASIENQNPKQKEKRLDQSETTKSSPSTPSTPSTPSEESTQNEQSSAQSSTESQPKTELPISTTQNNSTENGSGTSNVISANQNEMREPEQENGSCYISEKPRLIVNLWKYFETGSDDKKVNESNK